MREPASRVIGPITRTDVVRYQGASGDLNPVHHDEPFASRAGYPAPLVVGMFGAGAMFAWASDWLGPANVRKVRCRWREPVFPGDILTITGKVVREYEETAERKVDLELTCSKQDGSVAVLGWATFVVTLSPPREGAGEREARAVPGQLPPEAAKSTMDKS